MAIWTGIERGRFSLPIFLFGSKGGHVMKTERIHTLTSTFEAHAQ
jgi:hypothetical protein